MKAIVFAGQGCQKKGMGLDALSTCANASKMWHTAESRVRSRTGVSITEIIRDNPPILYMLERALEPETTRITDPDPNLPESYPKPRRVSSVNGLLGTTYLTQPAVLTSQMALLEAMKEKHRELLTGANVFAGHSLGEFTALSAMGVIPVDVAAELTFRRGVWMEKAITLGASARPNWLMYAVNPSRAKLDTVLDDGTAVSAEDVLAFLVELIAIKLKHTTSWVEVVNYNVGAEQWVVAGDEVALSILGKCVDPMFRANISLVEKNADFSSLVSAAAKDTLRDVEDGVNNNPNAPPVKDFVSSSWHAHDKRYLFVRRMISLDDGQTLPLDRLTHLTLENEGRSGLKKKSWYVPLSADVPFHSSHLRRAMDNFHQDCIDALPSAETIEKVLSEKMWVCNLTGSTFNPSSPAYLRDFSEAVVSQNIGERTHAGKYASIDITQRFLEAASVKETSCGPKASCPKALMAATMAAQLAHAVQWIDSMKTITDTLNCRTIVEISPTRTLAPMFRKSTMTEGGSVVTSMDHAEITGFNVVSLPTESSAL